MIGIKLLPYLLHLVAEVLKIPGTINDKLLKLSSFEDKMTEIGVIISITKVPYRAKSPLGICTLILVEIATAMKSLLILQQLTHDIHLCQRLDVYILFPFRIVFIIATDSLGDGIPLCLQIVLLLCGERLWGMISKHHILAAQLHIDMRICIIIVYLHEPSARDSLRISRLVSLLYDVNSFFINTYLFGYEIQALIFSIEHQFNRL